MALHKFIEEKTEKLIRRIAYETCYKCNNISQNYEPNNINFHGEYRGRYTISSGCSFVSMRYAMRASSLCKRRCCCCLSYKHKLGELIELRRAQIPVPCSTLSNPSTPSHNFDKPHKAEKLCILKSAKLHLLLLAAALGRIRAAFGQLQLALTWPLASWRRL